MKLLTLLLLRENYMINISVTGYSARLFLFITSETRKCISNVKNLYKVRRNKRVCLKSYTYNRLNTTLKYPECISFVDNISLQIKVICNYLFQPTFLYYFMLILQLFIDY